MAQQQLPALRSTGAEWRRPGKLLSLLLFPLLLAGAIAPLGAQDCSAPTQLEDRWGLSVHDPTGLVDQLGEPATIRHETTRLPNRSAVLLAETDVHVLYDLPLKWFERTIRDIENHEDYLPRIETSRISCSIGDPVQYAQVRHDLSFEFLFFGSSYSYRLHYFIEDRIAEKQQFRTWWSLAESLDGQMAGLDGSWFLSAVTIEGQEYTYLRYATRTVFAETVFGLRSAFERFGARDVARLMEAVREEAQSRAIAER